MSRRTDRLAELIRLPPGCKTPAGHTSKGLSFKRFTAVDRLTSGSARGYLATNQRARTVEIVLDEDSPAGKCGIFAFLIGLHESGHALGGDVGPGSNALRFGDGDRQRQEARAWQFTRGVAAQTLGDTDHLKFCLDKCAGGETPKRCEQPDLGGLFEQLAKPAAKDGDLLAIELLNGIKLSPNWFAKAAKGLKGSDGKPLIGKKRQAEASFRPRKRRQKIRIRDCAGGICGPTDCEPEPQLIWVRASDGKVMSELDPRLRLWHAD